MELLKKMLQERKYAQMNQKIRIRLLKTKMSNQVIHEL